MPYWVPGPYGGTELPDRVRAEAASVMGTEEPAFLELLETQEPS